MKAPKDGRLCAALADVAVNAPCIASYRRQALQLIDSIIGFDFGTVHSTRRGATGHGYDVDDSTLSVRQAACVSAFSPEEIRRISAGDVVLVEEVFAKKRRDELRGAARVFALDASSGANWGRATPVGFVGLFIVRERGSSFTAHERDLLAALSPILTLAEALHATNRNQAVASWTSDIGLSARQCQIADLVVRGCKNREIATLLGCSEFTVRNHLAAAFVKARVQSRQELIFQAMTHDEAASALPGYRRADRIALMER